jgi:hypothetical protein
MNNTVVLMGCGLTERWFMLRRYGNVLQGGTDHTTAHHNQPSGQGIIGRCMNDSTQASLSCFMRPLLLPTAAARP